MARFDKTFSDDDIIRIIRKNLTRNEANKVKSRLGVPKEADFLDFFPKFVMILSRIPGPVGKAASVMSRSLPVIIRILRSLGA